MKVINKKYIIDSEKVEQIIMERKILSMLDHPYIVALHWAFTSVGLSIYKYNPIEKLFIFSVRSLSWRRTLLLYF